VSTDQGWVTNKLACQPKERLLKVVVGLGGDVVVLEILLSVESDGLGLHLSLLHVNLVSGEDDGDILADTDQVTLSWSVNIMFESSDYSRCQLGTFL
jgi:hypothetical protein